MPQFAANLSLMYTELPFLDRFAAAARDGFTAVEYLFPYAYDAHELAARLRGNGLQQVLFNAPPGGSTLADMAGAWDAGARGTAALPGRQAEFRAGVQAALRYAEVLDCPRIHLLSGNVYVTGVFQGTVDFDTGPSTYNLTSAGDKDVFVAKYSATGTLVWAISLGGTGTDTGNGIAVSSSGNVYVVGGFSNTATFGSGSATVSLTSAGSTDAFVAKLD